MTKWPTTFPSTRFYLLRCEKLKMCKFVPKKLIFPDQRCTKMQSNTSVSVKSLVSALTSDQMQLWYAFGFFTQYQQLAQHIDRNRSWMPFQRDSEFSQNPNQSFIGYVYKNSLKSQLSFRINVRKANLNYIYIFICLSHFLAELFSTPLRQRYCCNIAGHHNLPGEKFTKKTKIDFRKWTKKIGLIAKCGTNLSETCENFQHVFNIHICSTSYGKGDNLSKSVKHRIILTFSLFSILIWSLRPFFLFKQLNRAVLIWKVYLTNQVNHISATWWNYEYTLLNWNSSYKCFHKLC